MPVELVKNKNRNNTADLLKGLAVVFMIQVHIMELFARQQIYDSIIGKISLFLGGPPCAPVFMGVMGFFLLSPDKSFKNYLQRGLLLFTGGILLNIGLNGHLLLNWMQGQAAIDPFIYIFGVDILPLAGISIILLGLLRFLFKDKYIVYFVLSLLVALVTPYLPQIGEKSSFISYINAFFWGRYNWSYFPLFPWFAYVLTGYAFRIVYKKYTLQEKFTISHSIVFSVPLVIAAILTVKYGAEVAHDLKGVTGYYHHGVLYFGWILLFVIAYTLLVHIMQEYSGKNYIIRFLRWTGRNVTAFYVVQWLIIGNVATAVYKSQDKEILMFWFAGILAATSIIVLAYNIIKNKIQHK